jgi:hypothetical protein
MANTYTDFGVSQNDEEFFGAMVPGIVRRCNVLDKDLSEEPGTPSEGDRYIIPPAGWDGSHGNKIAEYHAYKDEDIGWKYFTPLVGFIVYVEDEAVFYFWDGSSWEKLSTALGGE